MGTCFFVTPFTADGAGGEDPELFETVQEAVRGAAEDAEVELRRADDIFAAGVVIDQIRGEIERADLVIAVCTGRNPNVFYELGLADAANHRPILVAAESSDLPFDVQHRRAQLYGSPQSPDDLRTRISLAIAETLVDSSPRDITVGDAPPVEVEQRSLEFLASDDFVRFAEGAKSLIDRAGNAHDAVARDNHDVRPGDSTLEDLRELRHDSVEAILDWLRPAAEYRPEWLDRPSRLMRGWFYRPSSAGSGGYEFWTHIHQSWVVLALRALACLSLGYESAEAIRLLMALEGDLDDDSPLLVNPMFTWPAGYHGDSEIAFLDLVQFSEQSAVIDQVIGTATAGDQLDLVCGTDLSLGMARVAHDAVGGAGPPADPRSSRVPHTYAGFAAYYCSRIQWAGRLLDTREDLVSALAEMDLESFRATAAAWYPALASRTSKMTRTCDSWRMATARP